MTREEAEAKAKENSKPWFCPVIGSMCRTDCYCYIKPSVHGYSIHEDNYSPVSAYCIHKALQEE